jgi:hypothetical protein
MRYTPKMLTDELLIYLFEGQPHILSTRMAAWLTDSRRFAAFVNQFSTKIRKKLRATHGTESLLDLQLELETAYLLLQEPVFRVVYEPLPIRQTRGPDFEVSFTTKASFMLEVTRLRITQDVEERLADMVCSKLGQLPPQHSNVLVVGMETSSLMTPETLRGTMLRLLQRAERADANFAQRYGFLDRADFIQHYQRLSEVLVRESDVQPTSGEVIGWINLQAKYPLSSKVRTALQRSQHARV